MQIELMDITKEIYQATKRLEEGASNIFTFAQKKAETERNYRQALCKEIVRLKDEKFPVTLIPDMARGNTADLKFERDLADAQYTSARDCLEALSQQLSGLQSILKIQEKV